MAHLRALARLFALASSDEIAVGADAVTLDATANAGDDPAGDPEGGRR
ncbi:MAG TPA: hypothetical protein VK975_07570 [Acidimicrobiales bacterium]|nr:hypothetical protein [Acidimicrobiales bacterium]